MILLKETWNIKKKEPGKRDLPGGLVAKTPHSQFRGPRFDPWSGN